MLLRKIDSLPNGPGVYLWKDAGGTVLYVGKAKNLRSRVRSYLASDQSGSVKNARLRQLIADVDTIVVPDEAQSLLLENTLIKEHQPRFNIRLKDDKSYPCIVVTIQEPFPRVLVTRRRDIPGARYFGPFTDVSAMRRSLGVIRRIFTVRSCADDIPSERRERPCLDFHIGRCRGPCVGWQGEPEYRAMIAEVLAFLEGDTVDVRGRIRDLMVAGERADRLRARQRAPRHAPLAGAGRGASRRRAGRRRRRRRDRVRPGRRRRRRALAPGARGQGRRAGAPVPRQPRGGARRGRAERVPGPLLRAGRGSGAPAADAVRAGQRRTSWLRCCPRRRSRFRSEARGWRWIELAEQNARHLLESLRLESFEVEERAEDPVYALGRDLGLTVVPRSLACVDISHNQGRDMVGSLVWFEAGRPKKAEYRRFRIKGLAPAG